MKSYKSRALKPEMIIQSVIELGLSTEFATEVVNRAVKSVKTKVRKGQYLLVL